MRAIKKMKGVQIKSDKKMALVFTRKEMLAVVDEMVNTWFEDEKDKSQLLVIFSKVDANVSSQ